MALPSKTAPLEMDIAVIAYKASRVTGGGSRKGQSGEQRLHKWGSIEKEGTD